MGAHGDKSFRIWVKKVGCRFELDGWYFVCYNFEVYSQSEYSGSE